MKYQELDIPMIEFQNVTKTYGKKVAVSSVTLEVKDHEILGLAGTNGAGKTTCIKIATGIVLPDSGDVTIDGMSVRKKRSSALKNVGWIPEYPILENLDTPDNLFSDFGTLFDYSRFETKIKAENVMAKVGLKNLNDKRFSSFSNGMKKRFLIALALFQNPKNYLFDESFSGLDPVGIKMLKDILLELRDSGSAIILSSHILPEIEETADRVAIIHNGSIIDISKLTDIMNSTVSEIKVKGSRNIVVPILERIGDVSEFNEKYLIRIKDGNIKNAHDLVKFLDLNGLKLESINYGGERLEEFFLRKIKNK